MNKKKKGQPGQSLPGDKHAAAMTGGNPIENVEYIAQMLKELRRIAETAGEGTLVYMIDMAAMEAEESVRARRLAQGMNR